MQLQCVGDFPQGERAHGYLAMIEELPLLVNDRLGHPEYGIEPLLDIL